MREMPASPYIEHCGQGCRVAGTRISLDSVIYAHRRGESVDEILEDFPYLRSREMVEGVIQYIDEHPAEVERYLAEGEELWKQGVAQNPPEIMEKIRKYKEAKGRKSA